MLAPRLALSLPRPKAEALAMRYLERVRVAEQAGKYPAQLSGGQQQRVAVARRCAWSRASCCSTSRHPRSIPS